MVQVIYRKTNQPIVKYGGNYGVEMLSTNKHFNISVVQEANGCVMEVCICVLCKVVGMLGKL